VAQVLGLDPPRPNSHWLRRPPGFCGRPGGCPAGGRLGEEGGCAGARDAPAGSAGVRPGRIFMRLSLWGLWTQKDERVDLGGTLCPSVAPWFVKTTAPEGVGWGGKRAFALRCTPDALAPGRDAERRGADALRARAGGLHRRQEAARRTVVRAGQPRDDRRQQREAREPAHLSQSARAGDRRPGALLVALAAWHAANPNLVSLCGCPTAGATPAGSESSAATRAVRRFLTDSEARPADVAEIGGSNLSRAGSRHYAGPDLSGRQTGH
jgi:hypothetical protein